MGNGKEDFGGKVLEIELFLIACKEDGYGIEIINEKQEKTIGYITKDELDWEIEDKNTYIKLKINNIEINIEKNIKSIKDFEDYLLLNTTSGKIVIREA